MIVIAVLLLAVAVALAVAAVMAGGDWVTVEVFDATFDITLWGIFLAGVVAGLALLAAVALFNVGTRQVRSRRREVRELRRKVADLEGEAPARRDEPAHTEQLAHTEQPAHTEQIDERVDRKPETDRHVAG